MRRFDSDPRLQPYPAVSSFDRHLLLVTYGQPVPRGSSAQPVLQSFYVEIRTVLDFPSYQSENNLPIKARRLALADRLFTLSPLPSLADQ